MASTGPYPETETDRLRQRRRERLRRAFPKIDVDGDRAALGLTLKEEHAAAG
jgi:hypothetical protein